MDLKSLLKKVCLQKSMVGGSFSVWFFCSLGSTQILWAHDKPLSLKRKAALLNPTGDKSVEWMLKGETIKPITYSPVQIKYCKTIIGLQGETFKPPQCRVSFHILLFELCG